MLHPEIKDENAMIALSQFLARSMCHGDPEEGLSYMNGQTVCLSDGGPLLVGVDAIRERFSTRIHPCLLRDEKYRYVAIDEDSCCVNASLVTSSQNLELGTVIRISAVFRQVQHAVQMIQIHVSREHALLNPNGTSDVLPQNLQTVRFIRQLLQEYPVVERVTVQSEGKSLFLNPYLIRYIQSRGKQCEIFYEDTVYVCQCALNEIARLLPSYFYMIHRCYIVNTYHVMSLRRFEVVLTSGTVLPVPEHRYTTVKRDFHKFLQMDK